MKRRRIPPALWSAEALLPLLRPARRRLKQPSTLPSLAILLALAAPWFLSPRAAAGTGLAALSVHVEPTQGWLTSLALVFALLFSALYVGAETALDLLRPMHVKHAREKGAKRAERLEWQIEHRASLVAATILGRQTMKLAMVFFGLMLASKLAATNSTGQEPIFSLTVWYSLLIVIPVGLLSMVIDLVPKSYATLHPHRVAFRLDGFMRASWVLFGIPAAFITFIANLLTSRFGGQATFEIQNPVEEEIKVMVESAEESGEIEGDERELLHSVFEFTDTVAREIMTPRVDLDAKSISSDPKEVIKLIQETGHSRIPLYEDTDDQIVGIVHAKDILLEAMNTGEAINLRSLMRPALFVPENKSLHDLLREMRQARTQLAVVQDEFGGTAGIVTVEDIVEELFGDIVDEYDVEEPSIQQLEGAYLVGGKMHVDDVNASLGSDFDSEEFDTIGGYVFGLFGRQPKPQECLDDGKWRFCVAETNGRRILQLRIEQLPEPAAADQAEVPE
jgi:putative hemolysin